MQNDGVLNTSTLCQVIVLWILTPCWIVGWHWCFRGIYYLHFQGDRIKCIYNRGGETVDCILSVNCSLFCGQSQPLFGLYQTLFAASVRSL